MGLASGIVNFDEDRIFYPSRLTIMSSLTLVKSEYVNGAFIACEFYATGVEEGKSFTPRACLEELVRLRFRRDACIFNAVSFQTDF